MEYLGTFMKNKTSMLVIYKENKPCADYAKRNWRGGEIRSSIKYYVYQLHCKGNLLVERGNIVRILLLFYNPLKLHFHQSLIQ